MALLSPLYRVECCPFVHAIYLVLKDKTETVVLHTNLHSEGQFGLSHENCITERNLVSDCSFLLKGV